MYHLVVQRSILTGHLTLLPIVIQAIVLVPRVSVEHRVAHVLEL